MPLHTMMTLLFFGSKGKNAFCFLRGALACEVFSLNDQDQSALIYMLPLTETQFLPICVWPWSKYSLMCWLITPWSDIFILNQTHAMCVCWHDTPDLWCFSVFYTIWKWRSLSFRRLFRGKGIWRRRLWLIELVMGIFHCFSDVLQTELTELMEKCD